MSDSSSNADAYWKKTINLIIPLMVVWFLCSYVCGIVLVDTLNEIQLFGFPLGFWFAQQGAIYVFLVLIFVYVFRMNKIDEEFDVHEQ